jgi:hypothetical protein
MPLSEADMKKLMLEAARAVLADNSGACHPTLSCIAFEEMTEAQLREMIEFHSKLATDRSERKSGSV